MGVMSLVQKAIPTALNLGDRVAQTGSQIASTAGADAQQTASMLSMAQMADRAMEMELFRSALEEGKGLTKGIGKQGEDAGKAATGQ